MPLINETDRSFAPLRMTTKRNHVILSGAKDLYALLIDFTSLIPQVSVNSNKSAAQLLCPRS